MEGARPLNIEEEKEASRIRMENKRAQECAERLITTLPGGSTPEELMVAGLERWPGMSTDQHAAILKVIRNRLEGEDDMSRARVVELQIWLRTHIKAHLNTDPTLNLKAPATWTLAQEAGVASVTYDTFRTQYFYPIRDEVREELGIAKPVPKKGQKGFKTLARQKADEKKAKDRREKAEAAAEALNRENTERAADAKPWPFGAEAVASQDTKAHEEAHQELAEKVSEKPERERRPHPLPVGNTLSIAEIDAMEKGKQGSSEPPTYPEVTPPQAPSEPQVGPKWASSDPQVTLDEPAPEIPFCEEAGPSPSNRGIAPNGNWSCLVCGAKGPPEKGHGAHLRGVNLHPDQEELQEEFRGEEHTTTGFEETGPSPLPLEELDIRGPEKGGESPTEGPCQHRTINQRGQCSVWGKELAEAPAPQKDRQELREEYLRDRKWFGQEDIQRWLRDVKLQALDLVAERSEWICFLGGGDDGPITITAEDRQLLIRLIGIPPIEEMRDQIRTVLAENNREYFKSLPKTVLNLELDSPAGDLHFSVRDDGTVTSEITATDKNGFWSLQKFQMDLLPRLGAVDFTAPEDTEE